jgi:hypothetical protein
MISGLGRFCLQVWWWVLFWRATRTPLPQPKSSVSTVADAECLYLIPLYLRKITCKYHWTAYSYFILNFFFFVIVIMILSDLWIWYKSSMDTPLSGCLQNVISGREQLGSWTDFGGRMFLYYGFISQYFSSKCPSHYMPIYFSPSPTILCILEISFKGPG